MSTDVLMIVIGVAAALSIGLAVGSSSTRRGVVRLERRLAVVERKLDRVLEHLGVAEPEAHIEEVEACLSRGRKIEAIKVYRDATGVDLKEAKDAVERIARER